MSEASEVSITYSENDMGGRYIATVSGIAAKAKLAVGKVSDTLIVAIHTEVPEAMAGHGVGKALAERLIADARAKGQRIVALCPFVRAYATKRKDELADVFQW